MPAVIRRSENVMTELYFIPFISLWILWCFYLY
jgi:hypothetical protein